MSRSIIFYKKLCSAPYTRTRPTMNEHPHDAIRFPIPYDTMQRLLRSGRIERSRHFAAMMAQTAEAARAFVRGLIRKERFPAWSSRPGACPDGQPAEQRSERDRCPTALSDRATNSVTAARCSRRSTAKGLLNLMLNPRRQHIRTVFQSHWGTNWGIASQSVDNIYDYSIA